MSYVIGHGRNARETYPTSPGTGGGSAACSPAVVFSPVACTASTNIRSARSAHQSPITSQPVGATNLGSDTTGATTGVSAAYAAVGGGDQNVVDAEYGVIPGGALSHVHGTAGVACGDEGLATATLAVAVGGEAVAPGTSAVAIGTSVNAYGANSAAFGGGSASADESLAFGGVAGGGVFTFTIAADGTTVSITGNATDFFFDGDGVTIQPFTPAITASVSKTIASAPSFDGTNTTFSIDSPIDSTTTQGFIADTNVGAQSVCLGGTDNQTLGDASSISGGLDNLTAATATASRAGGIFAQPTRVSQDAWASGSDGLTAGVTQTSRIVLAGSTPGGATGESVELTIDPSGQNLPMQLDDGKAYTFRLSVVVAGTISGTTVVRSFEVETTVYQTGSGITVSHSATIVSQGDAGGASWTVAAAAAGSGPTLRLAFTFSTGSTQARTSVAALTEFTEVLIPTGT